MTTTPHITFDTPTTIASIPFLLGFRPQDSLVVIVVEVDSHIRVTMRVDLPATREDLPTWSAELRESLLAVEAPGRRAILAWFTDDPGHLKAVGSPREVRRVFKALAIRSLDRLVVSGGRWRSLDCHNPACCSGAGREVSAEAVDAAAALFGDTPVAESRDELRNRLADARPEDVDDVRSILDSLSPPREAERDMAIVHALETLRGCVLTHAGAALVLSALEDIRVRDTLLWDLLDLPRQEWAQIATTLERLVSLAPEGTRAPAATLLAVMQWQCGRGAHADVALDRAFADDESYYLAHLIAISVHSGTEPGEWLAALRALPREVCRRGNSASVA